MVWTLVEPGVAIIASSLVTIRPFLRQLRLKGFESTDRSAAYNNNNTGPGHDHGPSWSRSGVGNGRGGGLGASRSTRSAVGRWQQQQQQRGYGEMPGGEGPDDVGLRDLEKAYVGYKGADYYSEEEATVTTSRSSTAMVAGRTGWGGAVGITPREALGGDGGSGGDDGDDGDDDDDDDERILPVRERGARSEVSTVDSDLSVATATETTHQRGQGQGAWKGETPQSMEESDVIQGLSSPRRRDGER